jgi:hypothetical protein
MRTTPEPKDELDTTAHAFAEVMAKLGVNGPEDDILDWASKDRQAAEENVRRLRQRIFTGAQAGDLKPVRDLQKLMRRSVPASGPTGLLSTLLLLAIADVSVAIFWSPAHESH